QRSHALDGSRARPRGRLTEEVHLNRHEGQCLVDVVVKFASNAPPFLLLGVEQAATELAQFSLARPQAIFGAPTIRDVGARPDIADKCPVRSESRGPAVDDPTVFAVMAAKAVDHLEGGPSIEVSLVYAQGSRAVVRVDALGPPIAHLLFKCPPGE